MKRKAWIALLPIVFGYRMVAPMDDTVNHSGDPEVETQIALLDTPFGDGSHQRERDRAADWLIAHADRSFPLILARVSDDRAGAASIEILARFARAESIPPLERLLAGPESVAWAAGQSLALHPQSAAGDVLRRALAGVHPDIAVIAADALATRGDHDDCPALAKATIAADARVRYHAVQAADKLGCLSQETLQSLARSDGDAEVRALASRLLELR